MNHLRGFDLNAALSDLQDCGIEFQAKYMMADQNSSQYIIPNNTDVAVLDCTEAFNGLTAQEKLYAHHLAQASFKGGLIVLIQTSPESPGIFVLFQKLFGAQSPEEISTLAMSIGFSEEDVKAFLIYAAAFYCNMGNYKSFGDTKFIPNVERVKVEKLIKSSRAFQQDSAAMLSIWDSVKDRMYSLERGQAELGLGEGGTTTYYSANCIEDDAKIAKEFMEKKDISPYNTRLFKTTEPDTGKTVYEVRMAACQSTMSEVPGYPDGVVLGDYDFTPTGKNEAVKFKVTRGDYSPLMNLVVEELESAREHASNDNERNMLVEYMRSFTTGSLPAHKDGSRFWIQNTGPIVETYIGFIESYRDPFGVRGEFEGFVAVVNKTMSAKFARLVENAEHLLAHLPWPAEYEKDRFLRPDFTSLDVLGFGGSGIPAGINIPNYDDIRQSEGFKNVSLGNVLTSGYTDSKITFLLEEDKALYTQYKIPSFEVQVGLHELLGHGSGKLFMEDANGKLNFDVANVTHTETGGQIASWYRSGETWDSKFSTVASTYEECRAECVGIYLCLLADVLNIFGHTGDEADDIIYVNWLNMVRAGLLALEFYSPQTGSWKQAHMNARFVILRVLLEAGEGLVSVERVEGQDGKPDLVIRLDRSRILSVGKPAIGNFLRKLQVYKSTADDEAGRRMYAFYSDVNDHEEPRFLHLRSIVMDRKQPRKLFVQSHTYIENDALQLRTYEATASGVIQSFVDRFRSSDVQDIMCSLIERERPYF